MNSQPSKVNPISQFHTRCHAASWTQSCTSFEVFNFRISVSELVVVGIFWSHIARGRLLDEGALVDVLKSGKHAATGLDVHYDEPRVSPGFASMKNAEMMVHNVGLSIYSHIGFERLGMEDIRTFHLTGKDIRPVNAQLVAQAAGSTLWGHRFDGRY